MASSKPVEIAVVKRTYQGLEGNRVFAGTRFAVGKPSGDLKVISLARFNQLTANGLARPLGEEDAKALPRARYGAGFTQVIEGEGTGVKTARSVRQAARQRARQDENPSPPKAIAPLGSQTGAVKPVASSQAVPPSATSTSTSRGRRGGASGSSPSIMPTR